MDVAAAKATELPREGRERQKARKAASQTVRMGERKRSSTLWKKWGFCHWSVEGWYIEIEGELTIPPSRAKANIIREFDVMENSPQCHTQIIIKHIKITAPSSPNMSSKIWSTGCANLALFTVLSKF